MGGTAPLARTGARPKIAHEPALDGLRGVALVLVVLFHGGVGVVGGALGVDVFLVLSGYLITALLLAERDGTGTVDLPAFWGRRLRRLLPAVLVLVTVVAVHGAVTDAPSTLRLDALSTLGWWSNWRFAGAEAGYFDAFAAPSPLRHTWSLAVEEQWYLVWPPLLALLLAWTRRRSASLLAVVAGLTLASAAVMAAFSDDVDRAHFGTDTRAQGLLAGAALAVALRRWPVSTWRPPLVRGGVAAGVLGAVVLAWLALRVPGTDLFLYRGGHLLAAAASVALVAAALVPAGIVRSTLAWRPLQAVGRRSYGAYLWHWPLFVWITPESTGLDRWPLLAVRCAATAAATVASWHAVERPFLARPHRIRRPRLAVAGAVVTVAVVVVAATGSTPGIRSTTTAATAAPTLPGDFVPVAAPPVTASGVLDTPPAARPRDRTDPSVLLLGDSAAWTLGWAMEPVDGVRLDNGGAIGCGLDPAAVEINGAYETIDGLPAPCPEIHGVWRGWAQRVDPDVVLLIFGAWEVYDRQLADGTQLRVGTDEWRTWVDATLERTASEVAAAAPHAVLAVTDVPCFDERNLRLGGPTSPRNDPERVAAVNAVLDGFVARHPARVTALRWASWLCGEDPADRPDGVHLSDRSARELWNGRLGDAVRAIAATAP